MRTVQSWRDVPVGAKFRWHATGLHTRTAEGAFRELDDGAYPKGEHRGPHECDKFRGSVTIVEEAPNPTFAAGYKAGDTVALTLVGEVQDHGWIKLDGGNALTPDRIDQAADHYLVNVKPPALQVADLNPGELFRGALGFLYQRTDHGFRALSDGANNVIDRSYGLDSAKTKVSYPIKRVTVDA